MQRKRKASDKDDRTDEKGNLQNDVKTKELHDTEIQFMAACEKCGPEVVCIVLVFPFPCL